VEPLVFGPQSASSYRRDEGPADSTLEGGDDSATLDMLSSAGLDLILRGFADTVGATAGLMAVSDRRVSSSECSALGAKRWRSMIYPPL
jgi:hypothetical protein